MYTCHQNHLWVIRTCGRGRQSDDMALIVVNWQQLRCTKLVFFERALLAETCELPGCTCHPATAGRRSAATKTSQKFPHPLLLALRLCKFFIRAPNGEPTRAYLIASS